MKNRLKADKIKEWFGRRFCDQLITEQEIPERNKAKPFIFKVRFGIGTRMQRDKYEVLFDNKKGWGCTRFLCLFGLPAIAIKSYWVFDLKEEQRGAVFFAKEEIFAVPLTILYKKHWNGWYETFIILWLLGWYGFALLYLIFDSIRYVITWIAS